MLLTTVSMHFPLKMAGNMFGVLDGLNDEAFFAQGLAYADGVIEEVASAGKKKAQPLNRATAGNVYSNPLFNPEGMFTVSNIVCLNCRRLHLCSISDCPPAHCCPWYVL
jgi:hypothetical protein